MDRRLAEVLCPLLDVLSVVGALDARQTDRGPCCFVGDGMEGVWGERSHCEVEAVSLEWTLKMSPTERHPHKSSRRREVPTLLRATSLRRQGRGGSALDVNLSETPRRRRGFCLSVGKVK